MANVPVKDSAKFGRWLWNLRFAHSALVRIQKHGGLNTLSADLVGKLHPGSDLTEDKAVLLIWAGQSWCEPALTVAKVRKRLAQMNDLERKLLTTWACADYLAAVLKLLEAQLTKMATEAEVDDDDD